MDFQESRKKKERQRPFVIATNGLFAIPAEKEEEEKEKKEHNTSRRSSSPLYANILGCHHLKNDLFLYVQII